MKQTYRAWHLPLIALTVLAGVILAIWLIRARHDAVQAASRRELLRGDLLRLGQAQEDLFRREGRFADALGDAALGFTPSPGLVLHVQAIAADGWQAVANDPTLTTPPTRCGIFGGIPEASPHRSVLEAGRPACW